MCRPWADTRVRPYTFLHVLEPLLEETDDVVVVGDVVDVPAGAARLHEPHAAQQTQLMGDGGLGESEQLREVAHRHFGAGEGVEDPYARGVAEDLEGLGQGGHRRLMEKPRLQLDI